MEVTKGFSRAAFRGFLTRPEAERYLSSEGVPGAETDAFASSPSNLQVPYISGMVLGPRAYVVRFDGACKRNPGPGGSGALLYGIPPELSLHRHSYDISDEAGKQLGWNLLWKGSEYVGDHTTNNIAEYRGLLLGLKNALRLGLGLGDGMGSAPAGGSAAEQHRSCLLVQGDSDLVLRQMKGDYLVKAAHLMELRDEALELTRHLDKRGVRIEYLHILRDKNKDADALSNEGVSLETGEKSYLSSSELLTQWGLYDGSEVGGSTRTEKRIEGGGRDGYSGRSGGGASSGGAIGEETEHDCSISEGVEIVKEPTEKGLKRKRDKGSSQRDPSTIDDDASTVVDSQEYR